MTGRDRRRLDVAALAERAARDAGGVSPEFLDGYLEMLAGVSATGRRLARAELESRRALGASAAEQSVPLRALVDLYLSANWLSWRELPALAAASGKEQVSAIAEAVLRAADDAIVALADGYDSAQRQVMRQEGAARREFVDDLLHGRSDLGRLAERAERFGLRLAADYAVAAARADQPFTEGDSTTRRVEAALLRRFDAHEVLVTTRDGLLLCLAPGMLAEAPAEFARQVGSLQPARAGWQVGVGRTHAGPGGILRSYEEARGALDLAASLGLAATVLKASDLLVYQVLFRDRAAIIDLVGTVLGPLADSRGGARPLLDTLAAYFAAGENTAETARQLFLSVRAVTYRLDRVHQRTGYDPRDPAQRFTLEAAVLGARLLGWPDRPTQPA
ncbi:PucR family transcriptional regulator [Amycolatopsis sp. NPDC051758]|uniref:PucR family transcriptional regulator n=1 Tax=Amycolatopsis sp. NPDC051758 TaxID=3363935 RepID=UPI0037A253A3